MKYLVLHGFRTYGKYLERGTEVDESEIRSPLLRVSEGKITPAVSSLTAPPVPEAESTDIGGRPLGEEIDETGEKEPDANEEEKPKTEEKTGKKLNFGK